MVKRIKDIITGVSFPAVLSLLCIAFLRWALEYWFSFQLPLSWSIVLFLGLSVVIFRLFYRKQKIVESIFLYDDSIVINFMYWKPTIHLRFEDIDIVSIHENKTKTDIFYFIYLKDKRRYQLEKENISKENVIEYLERKNIPYTIKEISYEE